MGIEINIHFLVKILSGENLASRVFLTRTWVSQVCSSGIRGTARGGHVTFEAVRCFSALSPVPPPHAAPGCTARDPEEGRRPGPTPPSRKGSKTHRDTHAESEVCFFGFFLTTGEHFETCFLLAGSSRSPRRAGRVTISSRRLGR